MDSREAFTHHGQTYGMGSGAPLWLVEKILAVERKLKKTKRKKSVRH